MTLDKTVKAFAGGVALAHFEQPIWIWLTVFAGANMLQMSFTAVCPAEILFKLIGAKPGVAFK